jgi:hypothetical protein
VGFYYMSFESFNPSTLSISLVESLHLVLNKIT